MLFLPQRTNEQAWPSSVWVVFFSEANSCMRPAIRSPSLAMPTRQPTGIVRCGLDGSGTLVVR